MTLRPNDLKGLLEIEELADTALRLEPLEISDAGYRAHIEEDKRANPIEDPTVLRKLFG